MNRSYTPAIDWLKCLGITLILYGHLAAWAPLADLPPIYSKQLGVAFFLFASGFSLSAETRDPKRVAFNRLFEIYLFGVPCALLVSLVSLSAGSGLQLSNYFPFAVGANVIFNNFPANPTTWYLGTYIQLILLWMIVCRRIPATGGVIAAAFFGEIAVRVLLMDTAGRFIAYMLLPNWTAVFLFGVWQERRADNPAPRGLSGPTSRAWPIVALVSATAGWVVLTNRMPFDRSFPFMRLRTASVLGGEIVVSMMISTLYLGATQLVYMAVVSRPAPRFVRFVARNTLIIFLAHMPLYYGLQSFVVRWQLTGIERSSMYMVLMLPGLAWVSEGVRRMVRPRALRDRIAALVLTTSEGHA